MNKTTKNLYKIEDAVAHVLTTNQTAQNNDFILYKEVCRMMNPVFLSFTFSQAMDEAMYMDMPVFESVRRARQKLQHRAPILYGTHIRNRQKRLQKQEAYKEFARDEK